MYRKLRHRTKLQLRTNYGLPIIKTSQTHRKNRNAVLLILEKNIAVLLAFLITVNSDLRFLSLTLSVALLRRFIGLGGESISYFSNTALTAPSK